MEKAKKIKNENEFFEVFRTLLFKGENREKTKKISIRYGHLTHTYRFCSSMLGFDGKSNLHTLYLREGNPEAHLTIIPLIHDKYYGEWLEDNDSLTLCWMNDLHGLVALTVLLRD